MKKLLLLVSVVAILTIIIIYVSSTTLNAYFVGVFPLSSFPSEGEIYSMPITLKIRNKCPILLTDIFAVESISATPLPVSSYYYDHNKLFQHGTTGVISILEFNDCYSSHILPAQGAWVKGNGAEELLLTLEPQNIWHPNWKVVIRYKVLGILAKEVQVK